MIPVTQGGFSFVMPERDFMACILVLLSGESASAFFGGAQQACPDC